MYVVTNGNLDEITDAIVVTSAKDAINASHVLRAFLESRGKDSSTVTVNPIGNPVDLDELRDIRDRKDKV